MPANNEMNFEVGDIVRLRSGSPALTVSHVMGSSVMVHWFNEGAVNNYQFPKAILEPNRANQYARQGHKD
jgi:uncharacterized protein YodC (DUF2158 family)